MTHAELRTYFATAILSPTLTIRAGTITNLPANVSMNLGRLDGEVPLLSRLAGVALNEIANALQTTEQ